MKRLTFRGEWVGPILAGEKSSTVRRPATRLPAEGETFALICRYHEPPFAVATVEECRDVTADQLTEEDARRDGFATLAELVARLDRWGEQLPPTLLVREWRLILFTLDS